MRSPIYLLTAVFAVQTAAQSSNLLSILVSQAYSIFTSVTQELGNPGGTTTSSSSSTSQTAATTSSSQSSETTSSSSASVASTSSSSPTRTSRSTNSASAASSSVSSSPSVTSQVTLTHTLSSSSKTSGSGTAAAASASSAGATASTGGNHDRTLAIVLGTVLGALALGLLILLGLLLCRRRRRRRDNLARRGSMSSISDEALATHKTPKSRILPLVAAVSTPRRSRSSNRKSQVDTPLMSERPNYTVPSPHEFREDSSSPFFPGANHRSSTIDPTTGMATDELTNPNSFRDGTGLNNHPYHENHHAGAAALAAGAGGAALGAAAARRHSRSSERRDDVRLSGDPTIHPAYWDEPPPRSPHRNSVDSARRRSGSMPRGSLTDINGHSHSPLRDGMTAAAAGAAGGAAAGAMADHSRRQNPDRGRSLPMNPPAYSQSMNGPGPNPQRYSNGGQPGVPPLPHGQGQPVGQNNMNPLTPSRSHPGLAAGAAGLAAGAAGAGLANRHHNNSQSRSRSRSHPPLPPALAIPNQNQRRSVPSRSPKRTRFVDSDPHEPMPLSNRPNNGILSPPTTSNSSSRNSTTGPISPVSADGTPPINPQSLNPAMAGGKLGVINPNPRRDHDVSPERALPPTAAAAAASTTPSTRPIDPATATLAARAPNPNFPQQPTRRSSGLVNAVQDHFSPTQGPAPPGYTYKAYSPSATRNPAPGFPDEVILVSRDRERGPRSVNRKPVPHSALNPGVGGQNPGESGIGGGMSGQAGPGGVRSSGGNGNWWRNQEDSAWANEYTPGPGQGYGQGQDWRRSSGGGGGGGGGIGRAR